VGDARVTPNPKGALKPDKMKLLIFLLQYKGVTQRGLIDILLLVKKINMFIGRNDKLGCNACPKISFIIY
jgi:hypothetical protein